MSKDYENLSDQELDDLINNEQAEEADTEPDEPDMEEPEEAGDDDTGEQISLEELSGEADTEQPDPEEPEQPAQAESVKHDSRFKNQDDAEKSYFELQKLYGKQAQELGELRKEVSALKTVPRQQEQQATEPEITPEQLADLWVDNPQLAMEYVTAKAVERMQMQTREQQEAARRDEAIQKTNDALVSFVESRQDTMQEKDFNEFAEFLRDNVKTPKAGYYTKEDLDRAYGWWKGQDILRENVENAKRDVLRKVSDASPKVKTLSTAANAKATGKPDLTKARDRYEVENIASGMSNDELDEALSKI